jgi:hypothetical protein
MRHSGRAPSPPTRRGEPAHSPPRAGCPSASQASVPNCAPLCYCQPPFFFILGPPLFVFLSTPLCHSEPLLPCHSEPKARNPSLGTPRSLASLRMTGSARFRHRLPWRHAATGVCHRALPLVTAAVLPCSEPSFAVIPSRASLSFRAEGEESQPRHAEIPRFARDDERTPDDERTRADGRTRYGTRTRDDWQRRPCPGSRHSETCPDSRCLTEFLGGDCHGVVAS